MHERLRLARQRAGFRSAAEAARALKVPYGTYSGHEAGSRGFNLDDAVAYAETFQVGVYWLAFGENDDAKGGVDVAYLGRIEASRPDIFNGYSSDEMSERPYLPRLSFSGPEQAAIEIKGRANGFFTEDWIVYIELGSKKPGPRYFGRLCLCSFPGPGTRVLRVLDEGKAPHVFDLRHEFLPTLRDQVVVGVQLVLAFVHRDTVERIAVERAASDLRMEREPPTY